MGSIPDRRAHHISAARDGLEATALPMLPDAERKEHLR